MHPLNSIISNIPNITEPVSVTTTGVSNPHSNGKELPPIFSQTQTVLNESCAGYDDEESTITESSEGPQFDEITTTNVFDDTDD